MKVYSWNMLFRNQHLDNAIRWIERLDFDMLCLQEVPESFVEKLRSLPWHIAVALEGTRHFGKREVPAYLVTISKHPIAAQAALELEPPPSLLRVRLFIALMRPFHFTHVSDRTVLCTDLAVPDQPEPLRIVNAHLSLSYPGQRAHELAQIFPHALQPALICGDFNVVESYKVSLLNYLMGGTVQDVLHPLAERERVERVFARHGFKNPLFGQITHPFSLSQLDHILVPASSPVKRCGVLLHGFGSDHRPIFVVT